MKFIYAGLALIAGVSLGIEGGLAGPLGQRIGELETALFIFSFGFISLLGIVLLTGKGDLSQTFKVSKWKLSGGLFGTFYNLMLIVSVPIVGVSIVVLAALIGQMATSTVIEHKGWLEVKQIRFDKNKAIALLLLLAALYFVN